mgnify:CR=1 FL=1
MSNKNSIVKGWVIDFSEDLLARATYKTGNKEVAQDIVQDTFHAAFQSFERFEGRSNPKTWLFSILNNKITDHYRKVYTKKEKAMPFDLSQVFNEDGEWHKEAMPVDWEVDDDQNLADNEEFRHVLQNCMQNLPEAGFIAIQNKYYEEKDSRDICKELDITPTNYWQIIHRAKLQLRECLEINWIKS